MQQSTNKIILILLMCFPYSVFAQRLNKYGLKVVKEITQTSYEDFGKKAVGDDKYVFGYDEDLNMVYMSCANGHEVYRKVGGNLKRFNKYESPGDADFCYYFNAYGHIEKIDATCYGDQMHYDFEYSYNEELGRFQLKRFKSDDRDETMVYEDGYMYRVLPTSDENDIRSLKLGARWTQDSTHVNDTNINLGRFLSMSSYGDSYMSFLTLSEWLPWRHEYLATEKGSCGCKYTYDSNRNLVKISQYSCGYLRYVFEITYLE